jgi:hypothetical protein
MPSSNEDPPESDGRLPESDEDAPASDEGQRASEAVSSPSLPEELPSRRRARPAAKDAREDAKDGRPRAKGERPTAKGERPSITLAVLSAYLALPATQRHLRNVAAGALGRHATRSLVDDVSSAALMTALTAKELAETEESMPAWVDGVVRNKAYEHLAAAPPPQRVPDKPPQ